MLLSGRPAPDPTVLLGPHRFAPTSRGRPIAAALLAVVMLVVAGCSSDTSSGTTSATTTGCGGTLDGVSVANPSDPASDPKVSSRCDRTPAALEVKDLLLGKGTSASPTATVTVQYAGVFYADGKAFDSTWTSGQSATFSLQQVVPGFAQGIGGTTGIQPMKIGGRRIMILPAALAYGASGSADGGIPPNTPLVFVVDLLAVD